jgi:putative ABC transport system substrate-binding protein
MKRREFITLLGGAAAAWPLVARAQQRAVPVIGYLSLPWPGQSTALAAAFRAGLAETGYAEGRNVVLEFRFAEENDRFPALAADLAQRQVAMIFAETIVGALAAKSATMTIPIVFATGADPVEDGLVASLNRPGANLTGVTILTHELIGKRMELLHEIVPAAATIGYLLDPTDGFPKAETKDAVTAAGALGVQLAILNASTRSQIETAFTTLVERRIGALMIGHGAFFYAQAEQLVRLAARHGIPVIYPAREFVDAGGLTNYGPNLAEAARLGRHLGGPHPQWREAGRPASTAEHKS